MSTVHDLYTRYDDDDDRSFPVQSGLEMILDHDHFRSDLCPVIFDLDLRSVSICSDLI